MPIATELNVDTSATAMDMANAMFGNGISITSASFTGAGAASGTYTGGLSTLGSLTQSDTGVILSTGNATDFTNSSGTTDTNTATGTSTNHTGVGEVDGDTDLNAVSGQATEDGAFFDATFVATGDLLTMQFVFTSEEYLEYVNGGVNDAMGIWVNGTYVPLTLADNSTQNVTIDTIN
ncbi:choice-of-anchor L domain-containing protein, partial [Lentibacter algarum]